MSQVHLPEHTLCIGTFRSARCNPHSRFHILNLRLGWQVCSLKESDCCRVLAALITVSLICELGVVCVTLLELFSGTNGNEEPKLRRQELAAVAVSLGTTILAFFVTIIGAGSAVSGAKIVWRRISTAGFRCHGLDRQSHGPSTACHAPFSAQPSAIRVE